MGRRNFGADQSALAGKVGGALESEETAFGRTHRLDFPLAQVGRH